MTLLLTFIAKDIYGNRVDLNQILQEKHVVLNFWATWCAHCDEELDKLNEAFGSSDEVQVIAISLDTKREINRVKQMAESHGWEFPIVIDEGKRIASRYAVVGLPTVIVYQKGGKLKRRIYGFNPNIVALIKETLGL